MTVVREVEDSLLFMCVCSSRERSVGDWSLDIYWVMASQRLHKTLSTLVPNGTLTVITSIYLILELFTLRILTVLWVACSNLGIMKPKPLIFQRMWAPTRGSDKFRDIHDQCLGSFIHQVFVDCLPWARLWKALVPSLSLPSSGP